MVYFKVLFAIVVWGFAFVFTKRALGEISPLTLITLRCILGSIIMISYTGSLEWMTDISRKDWGKILFLSVLGVFVQQLIQAFALVHTSANHAGWLIAVTPVVTVGLLAVMFGEKVGRLRSLGFLIGFIGTMAVIFSRQAGSGGTLLPTGLGDFLFLISCFTWAFYVILISRWLRDYPLGHVTVLNMFISCAIAVTISSMNGNMAETANLSGKGWAAVAYLGILGSGISYGFWNSGVGKLGPSRTVAFIYFQPFITLIGAKFMLGESISPLAVAGGILILGAVYWINGGRAGAETGKKIYCRLIGC